MDKKAMEITVQAMLAIFLMIFVSLVLFTAINSRSSALSQREQISSYRDINTFLVSLLSNPRCINIASGAGQVAVAGVLDSAKLDGYNNQNADLWCIRQGDFLYTLNVVDEETKKEWRLGAAAESLQWSSHQLGISLPIVVRYPEQIVHVGRATLTAYLGPEASLYRAIRFACLDRNAAIFQQKVSHKVSYDPSNRRYCIEQACFTAAFECLVDSFTVEPENELVYISLSNNKVKVST